MNFIFVLFILFALVVVIFGLLNAEKRRKELAAVAARLGLQYSRSDPFSLPDRYRHMLAFGAGHSRKAYNTMHGRLDGCDTVVTDYRYTTGSGKNSHTYHRTYCLLYTGKSFHNLQVRPENFMDKIAGWVGFDDIDFEYKEFNDAFYVRCNDKKFAYDIIHPKMMEYLLKCRGLHFEMADDVILAHYGRRLRAHEIEPLIRAAQGLHKLLPTYI